MAALTVQEFQARRIERIADSLAHFVRTTRPDRLDWSPAAEGGAETRSMLEQIEECIVVNDLFAALLRGERVDREAARNRRLDFVDVEDACRQLQASAEALAAVVRGLSDADLTRQYPFWRGPTPGERVIEMPYRNMAYHAGQINFIQTLYGDTEFHAPPTWA